MEINLKCLFGKEKLSSQIENREELINSIANKFIKRLRNSLYIFPVCVKV